MHEFNYLYGNAHFYTCASRARPKRKHVKHLLAVLYKHIYIVFRPIFCLNCMSLSWLILEVEYIEMEGSIPSK